jgi:hypothetical protein
VLYTKNVNSPSLLGFGSRQLKADHNAVPAEIKSTQHRTASVTTRTTAAAGGSPASRLCSARPPPLLGLFSSAIPIACLRLLRCDEVRHAAATRKYLVKSRVLIKSHGPHTGPVINLSVGWFKRFLPLVENS